MTPFILMTGVGILCVLLVLRKGAKDKREQKIREAAMDKKLRVAEQQLRAEGRLNIVVNDSLPQRRRGVRLFKRVPNPARQTLGPPPNWKPSGKADPNLIVSSFDRPDGAREILYEDGSREIISPDGFGSIRVAPRKEPDPFTRFSLIDIADETNESRNK